MEEEIKVSVESGNFLNEGLNTVYLQDEGDHIKLVQSDIKDLIYIKSVKGEEMLLSSGAICKLIRKFCDLNEWKGIGSD